MRVERRGATRYYFGAIAEVIDLDKPGELVSLTRDLSASGCFVKTTTPFPTGTRVRVRITHSGAEFAAIGNVTANVTQRGWASSLLRSSQMIEQSWRDGWAKLGENSRSIHFWDVSAGYD